MAKPTIKPTNDNKNRTFTEQASQVIGEVGAALQRAPFYRTAYEINDRKSQIMSWRIPSGSSVQMYINPQEFVISESKQIVETRTKGGFIVQYWGENLVNLDIRGTTGSSGIEGINVLRDIYRSESKGFDLIAAQLIGDIEEMRDKLGTESLGSVLEDTATTAQKRSFLLRPSLAALALNVIMFYQGVSYRGFFKSFSVTESASRTGLFDYAIVFTATEIRGQRRNFLPWHKSAVADDLAGNLINSVGNAVRGSFGLSPQPPETFTPATAPYTFGGSTLASGLGFAGPDSLTQERSIFL